MNPNLGSLSVRNINACNSITALTENRFVGNVIHHAKLVLMIPLAPLASTTRIDIQFLMATASATQVSWRARSESFAEVSENLFKNAIIPAKHVTSFTLAVKVANQLTNVYLPTNSVFAKWVFMRTEKMNYARV